VNYSRIALASLGAMFAYFVYGFAMFAALPAMKTEFMKYPNVYRPKDDMMKMMPYGMIAILIGIVVVAILYAKIYPAGSGIVSGVFLGALIGIFAVCTFVIHNYVNLNIGLTLTLYQSIAYFLQWVIVGAAIGLIYKPS
jgi:archaellum biogenesis protein FlaJ (TadC family)